MEKLVLALVHTVRRLRQYFQAHLMAAITDQPIRQILSRTENSRRQVLADFLAELPAERENSDKEVATNKEKAKEVWRLFTDGSSNEGGFGDELILIYPNEVEFTYALRFEFKVSNNEAEYEELLVGLRIA
ncbi:reverse transcriptase domain-containing protein [Tanacetum coccineum]|uniref:Reverse transcriptase domain-containing protein n=1 Tax=Tanacetum coccineum TaxID=301880 RepID=A0ABQ5AS52_9ASTR